MILLLLLRLTTGRQREGRRRRRWSRLLWSAEAIRRFSIAVKEQREDRQMMIL